MHNPLSKKPSPPVLDATVTPMEPRPHAGNSVADTIQRALESAGLNTGSGPMQGVTDTIQRALSAAGLERTSEQPARSRTDRPANPGAAGARRGASPALPGTFTRHSFTGPAGTRAYKLYVPSVYATSAAPVALVVMLHGCTQSPDDFAAGTRMNALAEQHGFIVVYPAQAPNANGSKCWNWFRAEDQQRGQGEPSLIAGITQEVASQHRIDRSRIYVAGLSAGAAMAVILGETYPDLYAAVGAHSGLAYGAAHDMASAFGAMKSASGNRRTSPGRGPRVPTIIFHGDQDRTVDVGNGVAIGRDALAARTGDASLRMRTETGRMADGSSHVRTVHEDASGRPVVEDWRLHGGGHAWSGGSPDGSYTDTRGPDASAEMVRFFMLHRRADNI